MFAGLHAQFRISSVSLTSLVFTTLPHAMCDIIFGLVVLGAVLALRDRQSR